MSAVLISFTKDEAAQELLGYAGIHDPYEVIIETNSLEILRRSVPTCDIESIRFVGTTGCSAGGMPVEGDQTKIYMHELKISFPIEVVVSANGKVRHRLQTVFEFDCSGMGSSPKVQYNLVVNGQEEIQA